MKRGKRKAHKVPELVEWALVIPGREHDETTCSICYREFYGRVPPEGYLSEKEKK